MSSFKVQEYMSKSVDADQTGPLRDHSLTRVFTVCGCITQNRKSYFSDNVSDWRTKFYRLYGRCRWRYQLLCNWSFVRKSKLTMLVQYQSDREIPQWFSYHCYLGINRLNKELHRKMFRTLHVFSMVKAQASLQFDITLG